MNQFQLILKLIGPINGVFFLIVLFLLLRKSEGMSLWHNSLSDLAFYHNRIFNLALAAYGFFQTLFMIQLIESLHLEKKPVVIVPFSISILSGILAACFPMTKNPQLHHRFAALSIFSACLGATILVVYLLSSVDSLIGIANLILVFPTVLILGFLFSSRKTLTAGHEFIFFIGLFFWNSLNTTLLFR